MARNELRNGVQLLLMASLFLRTHSLTAANTSTRVPVADAWHVRQWTTDDELPQNSARALAQTPDGYLWIGTLSGLARFDGAQFTVFDKTSTPEMVSDAINALCVDQAGTLWVGTKDGLLEWRGRLIKRWAKADGLPGKDRQMIDEILERPAGGIWFREGLHACLLHNAAVKTYGTNDGLVAKEVRHIARTQRGELLVLTQPGFQRLEVNGRFGNVIGWPEPAKWDDIEELNNGELWTAGEAGCYRLPQQEWETVLKESIENAALAGTSAPLARGDSPDVKPAWQRVGSAEGLSGVAHVNLFRDGRGAIWSCTRAEGLQCWDGKRFHRVPLLNETDQLSVTSLIEDREGNLWAGTSHDGLFRLRPNRIRSWTTKDGLPGNEVSTVCAGPDGSVWAATSEGMARIRSGRVESFHEPAPEHRASAVFADKEGTVWLVKHRVGVFRWHGGEFKREPAVSKTFISALYQDRGGRVWMGADYSVTHPSLEIKPNPFRPEFGNLAVMAILEDRAGRMWFGTKGGGLKIFKNDLHTTLTSVDGLCDNSPTSLYQDADGVIWIGSNSGLNRYKDGKLTRIGVAQGLRENTVNQILEDEFGDLWLGGLKGIHCVSRSALNNVANGRTNRVQCLSYGEADGMARSETNGEFQPAGCKTHDGHIWFPTGMGIVEVDPALMRENEKEAPIVIEQVKANERVVFGDSADDTFPASEYPPEHRWRFAPGSAGLLEIHFTANSFLAPEKLRFQYKLEPRDKDWHDTGNQRFAYLHDLRPRDYTFRVRAANPHGLWNERPASFAFRVEPHFSESWLFYLLCGMAIAGVTAGFMAYRLRWQRRLLVAGQHHALAEERARIARDLHDELGSRLTALAVRTELAVRTSDDRKDGRFQSLAAESRALAERMRDVIWTVDPECDSLEALAARLTEQAEEFLGAAGIRLRLDLPDALPGLLLSAEARHQLSMVAREALHNVVKHAHASEVQLGMELHEAKLRLRIIDDGTGLDESRRGGRGVGNMRVRVHSLGGTFQVHSRCGQGTAVEVTVPLKNLSSPSAHDYHDPHSSRHC